MSWSLESKEFREVSRSDSFIASDHHVGQFLDPDPDHSDFLDQLSMSVTVVNPEQRVLGLNVVDLRFDNPIGYSNRYQIGYQSQPEFKVFHSAISWR